MLLKVDHDELYDVTKVMNQDRDDYNKEIENMLQQIEKLKTIWQGEDADMFCYKAHEYISNMKKITNTMQKLSKFSDKANQGYAEWDDSFGKELEAEAMNYDEDA